MNTLFLANLMGPQGLLIMFVLLLLFGARKLPELARGLGQAIREFSKAKNDIQDEIMREPAPPVERPRQIVEAQTVHAEPVQPQPAANTQPVTAPQPTTTTTPV
jgi:sec-independent protein translocase protein TatA